jgi:hypothetical protein
MAMSGRAFSKWINEHNAGASNRMICSLCGKKAFSTPCPECQQDEYYKRIGNEMEKHPLAKARIMNKQKSRHDGDCTIYMSLCNEGRPEAGICTCGYGQHRWKDSGDMSEMYSKELKRKLSKENKKRS